MKDIKISTLIKFLEAIDECPRNTSRLNIRANLTFGTALTVRDMLKESGFIIIRIKDKRSKTLHITKEGRELLHMIKKIQ